MNGEQNGTEQAANPFEGIKRIGDTLVIPADRYQVTVVKVQDISRMSYNEQDVPTSVRYEVRPDPYWRPPSFSVGSCGVV